MYSSSMNTIGSFAPQQFPLAYYTDMIGINSYQANKSKELSSESKDWKVLSTIPKHHDQINGIIDATLTDSFRKCDIKIIFTIR